MTDKNKRLDKLYREDKGSHVDQRVRNVTHRYNLKMSRGERISINLVLEGCITVRGAAVYNESRLYDQSARRNLVIPLTSD